MADRCPLCGRPPVSRGGYLRRTQRADALWIAAAAACPETFNRAQLATRRGLSQSMATQWLHRAIVAGAVRRVGLRTPERGKWMRSETLPFGQHYWVTEVSQSAYGHQARKRTWLLHTPPGGGKSLRPLDWSDSPGTHQVGWFDRNKPTLGKKAASATPSPFRDLLLSMARSARAEAAE